MPIWVEVRGWARAGSEFQYLGQPPGDAWWRERTYDDLWSDQSAAVLFRSDGTQWSAFVAGVESSRRDTAGRKPPYTLVFEGHCGPVDDQSDSGLLYRLLANWLPEYGRADGAGTVSSALDARLPMDEVERLRALTRGGPTDRTMACAAAEEAVRTAVATLPEVKTPEADPAPQAWTGVFDSVPARTAFLNRIWSLLSGEQDDGGIAMWLNTVSTVGQAEEVAGTTTGRAAILMQESARPLSEPILEIIPKKEGVPVPAPGRSTAKKAPKPMTFTRVLRLAAMTLAALMLVGVVIWVARRETQN